MHCENLVYGLFISVISRFFCVVCILLCFWIHPQSWSEFCRRVGTLVLCGMVLSVYTLRAPPVFTLRGLHVLGCAVSPNLGLGYLSLVFLIPFGFARGGGSGVGGVICLGWTVANVLVRFLSHRFSPSEMDPFHTTSFHSFKATILTICYKAACFPSPNYLIGDACTVFFKNISILVTAFVMAFVVDMKVILVDCGKNWQCLLIALTLSLGRKPFMCDRHS